MSETSFLSGRVILRMLPEYAGTPPMDAPGRKRLHLPQGDLAQVHNEEEGMRYIAWLELREGGIRGNHYHERKLEHIYLIAGQVELTLEDLATGERVVVPWSAGGLVTIPPRIAHALRPLGPGQAVEFSPGRLEPADTIRYPLVNAG